MHFAKHRARTASGKARAPVTSAALAVLLAAAAALATASSASGEVTRFHPDLVRAQERLDKSSGPEAYAALRRIWATWDRADPIHVEEALLAAERSAKLAPAARVYAGLLAAYSRTRRGDMASARSKIAALGYVDHWLVVGPFDNEGRAGLDVDFGPEQDAASPITPTKTYSGKERPTRWRAPPPAFSYGWLDGGALMRPDRKICMYAATLVSANKASRAPRPITLWAGAAGAFRLFWNGEEVLRDESYRGFDSDRFAATVSLEPGKNLLLAKACGDDAAPIVSVRIGDARGGSDAAVEISSDFAASEAAAKLVAEHRDRKKAVTLQNPAKKQKPIGATTAVPDAAATAAPAPTSTPRKAPSGPEGPIQAFERITQKKEARPSDLQAYAEYLLYSSGEDPTKHEARDLARRAAEREPTIERLLLASQLAEDRNKQVEWIEKAESLNGARTPTIELLLARAQHARGGPNWRDAFPFYDRVLSIDADQVVAIRGRVELYNEAGLKRTALATLESALERNPRSVNLLNMYASQLRALGRTSDAAVAEERYAALRFDDRTFLSSKIELSTTRRDRSAAERWVDRLLEAEPDSQWALTVAARTYLALGQPERAIATYRRALELAPDDVATMRTLADTLGELGRRDEQLGTLREILRIRPQERAVRDYVEHIEAPKARADEAYAWDEKRFLKLRHAPAAGNNRRTLRDLTVTTVYANGLSSKFRQVAFQPLTDAAAAMSRQYAFQYQADAEVVQLRGARVYRGDGRVDEAVESGEAPADDPSIAMYTSARNFYVQFPRLEPGDVVELRYRVDDVTPRNEFADYFGEVVYLQSSEPVANAEYVLITPKSRKIYVDHKLPGLKVETREAGDQRIHRFFAEIVPALAPEPAMPPWPEVAGFVHVSTYENWQALGRWYWGLVKDQLDLDDETRKLAHDVAKNAKTDIEKVRAVYDWVVKNTRYVALELGIYGYKPRRCVQTVSRGWGDCKDKATVLVTLLKELGVPATIVVVRTQLRGGFRSSLASLAPFDHAIAYVPSLDLYLDGTAEFHGAQELPRPDQGALGILLNQGAAKLVTLPVSDPDKNIIERRAVATLSRDGNAKLDITYRARGTTAADWRRQYHAEATRRERIGADLGREFPGFSVNEGPTGLQANDLENIEQPVEIQIRGSAPGFARREGDQLSIAATTATRLTGRYASLSQRTQDVWLLGISTQDDTFVIKLPAGAHVVSAPAPVAVDTPFGAYRVDVEQQPGQVTVHSRLMVRAIRIPVEKYSDWQKFCVAADRAFSSPLVIGF